MNVALLCYIYWCEILWYYWIYVHPSLSLTVNIKLNDVVMQQLLPLLLFIWMYIHIHKYLTMPPIVIPNTQNRIHWFKEKAGPLIMPTPHVHCMWITHYLFPIHYGCTVGLHSSIVLFLLLWSMCCLQHLFVIAIVIENVSIYSS